MRGAASQTGGRLMMMSLLTKIQRLHLLARTDLPITYLLMNTLPQIPASAASMTICMKRSWHICVRFNLVLRGMRDRQVSHRLRRVIA